jgi:hypothetical protein
MLRFMTSIRMGDPHGFRSTGSPLRNAITTGIPVMRSRVAYVDQAPPVNGRVLRGCGASEETAAAWTPDHSAVY